MLFNQASWKAKVPVGLTWTLTILFVRSFGTAPGVGFQCRTQRFTTRCLSASPLTL